jgi:ankyrin repeat protein
VNTFNPKAMVCSLHLTASMDTKLTRLLLDHGAFMDFPRKSPTITSLHYAVLNSHVFQGALDRVSLLLERGAKINAQSGVSNTVLHMAILAGYQDLARFLLQKGVDITLKNKNGKSVLQIAQERGLSHWIKKGVPRDIF